MDDTDVNRDVVPIERTTRPDKLRNESVARRNKRRGKATTSRSKASFCTSLAIKASIRAART